MRRFISFGPAFVVMLTIAVVLLAVPAAVRRIGAAETSAKIVLAQRTLDDDDILERLSAATRAIATSVRPSLVHIDVAAGGNRRFGSRSSGSGWVYNDEGIIVTNAHVVRGADRISVQFADGRVVETEEIKGEAFVADPYTDVAVIKVPKGTGLFPLRRATGVQPQQGDHVFAFGSPFGFKFSMTQGIVSGLGRDPASAMEYGGFTNFIQTDAAVNPGNSGGPVVDTKGRMIGMSVAIATGRHSQGATDEDSGDSAGISFAIPLGTVESVVKQLLEHGEVSRGLLGIMFNDIQSRIVDEKGYRGTGVRVRSVTADGPADKAGLKAGDIITAVDEESVSESNVLRSVISSRRPGEEVKLKIWQAGEFKTLGVVLTERPKDDMLRDGAVAALMRYGMRVESGSKGPRINYVAPESAAASAGFERGQRITKVGDKAAESAEDFYLRVGQLGLLLGRRIGVTVMESDATAETEPKTIQIQILH